MGRAAAVLLSDPVSGVGFPLCVHVCACVEHTYGLCVCDQDVALFLYNGD